MQFGEGELMKTDSSLCVGCNKCIFTCPTHANDAVLENNDNKIHINSELCILCGECLDICDHNARKLSDDTERFFEDLKNGKKISILAAPALKHNISEYEQLFGYLKSLGAQLFFDVSFGADITVWGYLKMLGEKGMKTMISQPCPVIVNYIEHFAPHLLPYLSPIHSPLLCAGIYLKQYQKCTDALAFLSPCISKTVEIQDPHTNGVVEYNVTYKSMLRYIKEQNIKLETYEAVAFDNPKGGMGISFSRPGGLKENVRIHTGDKLWIKQIESIEESKSYLEQYWKRLQNGLPVPELVDVLNCRQGCNMGTATDKSLELDAIDYGTDKMLSEVDKQKAEALLQYFDEHLVLEDFIRAYSDKSYLHSGASEQQIEEAFLRLEKYTDAERSVNCFSCGYGNCHDFASAVALGQNHIENCFQYTRKQLARHTEELKQKQKTIISSLNYASKIQRNLLPNDEIFQEVFPEHRAIWHPKDIVGGDIYWLKNFEDGVLLCVCDCTGHGTPGALLTMLVVSALDSVVKENNHRDTAYIMWALDQRMKKALNVAEAEENNGWKSVTDINDGADLALLFVDNNGGLTVSAGNTHVFVCDGEKVQDIKGQKLRVGTGDIESKDAVKCVQILPNPKNKYYVASDGLFDQIGAISQRPFGYRPFKNIILEHHDEDIASIFDLIWHTFESYRGEECRRDDVALVGFRV